MHGISTLKIETNDTMETTLTTYQAADILSNDKDSSFTRAGALALVEHLENIEDETGEEMQFDSVEIRCNWGEYVSLVDWADDYYGTDRDGHDWKWNLCVTGDMDDDEIDDLIRERIRESRELIEFDEGVIVSNF